MSFNSYIDFKIKESLKILRFVHLISLGVLAIIGFVVFWLVINSGNTGSDGYQFGLTILVVVSATLVLISFFVANFLISRINKKKSSEVILRNYRGIYVFKYICLMLPILAGYLGYLYYSNLNFFMVSVISALIMIAQKPTKRNINRVIRA
ncbi:MAG: hypothetical protein JXQ87_00180 [Bacteroidia bacterium]